ncbi:IGHM protein, partial [Campylorhamphus procurvoides]|nr:IGHM protein [Campylorhamphus procurvoides]
TFVAVSHLAVPVEEGKARKPFRCLAEHSRGSQSARVSNPGPSLNLPPVLTLHPPSREEFQGPFRNSTLLCRVLSAQKPQLQWLKNGNLLEEAPEEMTTMRESSGMFLTESRVVVTESEWDGGATYTCRAGEESRNSSKGMEC